MNDAELPTQLKEKLRSTVCSSMGTLEIIHKIITTSKNEKIENRAEEAFWIIVGLIKIYPRCLTIEKSILTEECESVMRYEIITFKAIIQTYMSDVYEKFDAVGLPLEWVIYHPITSLYANYFPSNIVLRLWDIIFLMLSSYEIYHSK